MIIGIFGISGSGKTYLNKIIKKRIQSSICISASEAIRNYGGSIDHRTLSKDKAKKNQEILIKAIEIARKENPSKKIIIELHTSLITSEGKTDIELDVFENLKLERAVFIKEKPENIKYRIKNDLRKKRANINIIEIKHWQDHCSNRFSLICKKIKIKKFFHSDIESTISYIRYGVKS